MDAIIGAVEQQLWWGDGGGSGEINLLGIYRKAVKRVLNYICYRKWRGYSPQLTPQLRRPCIYGNLAFKKFLY